MKKILYKWFWGWDFDKEEKWLNNMAAKGLSLCSVRFCRYTFEDSEPGEYQVRIELLDHYPSAYESKRYIQFLEETGVEYVGAVTRWVYFRKRTLEGNFDLYSNSSKIAHMNRLLQLFSCLSLVNLCNSINMASNYATHPHITFALIASILCLSFSILCGYGFLRINHIKNQLKKDTQIYE